MTTIDDLDEDFILCNVCNTEYDDEQRAPKLLPMPAHGYATIAQLNAVKGSVVRCFICREGASSIKRT
ncbi:hypothetical protein DPMN_139049 [Dreissena polymorpha]|uniref:Uncharacterized protein n=1 Tax=Dreissena polymorpha TaxID=45954 RepID=A0A9D4G519_DREPO|nr:hypothetical protein DPMN_139049 [Dreissena polymorpha]